MRTLDEKKRTVAINEEGVSKVEEILGVDNLYDHVNVDLLALLRSEFPRAEFVAVTFALIWSAVAMATYELARLWRAYDYRHFFQRLLGRGWWLFEVCYVGLLLIVGFLTRWAASALLLYVLGLGSPTHPLTADSYPAWAATYQWKTLYGIEFLYAGPLFIHTAAPRTPVSAPKARFERKSPAMKAVDITR